MLIVGGQLRCLSMGADCLCTHVAFIRIQACLLTAVNLAGFSGSLERLTAACVQ